MSQERLGALLGVTYQQVQKYERGANRIGSSRLHELCRILGVPASYFFDEPSRQPAAWPRRRRLASTARAAARRAGRREDARSCCARSSGSATRRSAAGCSTWRGRWRSRAAAPA